MRRSFRRLLWDLDRDQIDVEWIYSSRFAPVECRVVGSSDYVGLGDTNEEALRDLLREMQRKAA
jgi:hypothetical protein